MLPEASRPVPLMVLPGHTVMVSLDQQAGDSWLIGISNLTSGETLPAHRPVLVPLSAQPMDAKGALRPQRVLPSQLGASSLVRRRCNVSP